MKKKISTILLIIALAIIAIITLSSCKKAPSPQPSQPVVNQPSTPNNPQIQVVDTINLTDFIGIYGGCNGNYDIYYNGILKCHTTLTDTTNGMVFALEQDTEHFNPTDSIRIEFYGFNNTSPIQSKIVYYTGDNDWTSQGRKTKHYYFK